MFLSRTHVRYVSALLAALISLCFPVPGAATTTASPASPGTGTIAGTVVDEQSGLALSGARVRIAGTPRAVVTGSTGGFSLDVLAAGSYRLRVERDGYQTTESTPVDVVQAGSTVAVTLSLARVTNAGTGEPATIASTRTRANESLQCASTIYRTLQPQALLETGIYRAGDALRTLPGVNNALGGDTASLSDDLQLQLRGLGTNETTVLLDGHPIAYGVPGGYNYQLTPAFSLRNINVVYGSAGTELTGYDAIGGIVDQQTLEPTRANVATLTEGYGSFDRAETSATASGSLGHLGYALAYGVGSLNGPFHDAHFYQPGAAYDPSATVASVRDLAVYKDSGMAVQRSSLQKVRYELSPSTRLELTALQSTMWEDKTGNGDGDYLTPAVALAQGNANLAAKSPKDSCPSGFFAATTAANGAPWGTGTDGSPDGGRPCQTPQSYASHIAGFQGAGPAWQSFALADEDVRFDTTSAGQSVHVDAFTDRYRNTVDRTFALPFKQRPGDNGFFINTNVTTSGAQAYDDFEGRNNELGVGLQYLNTAYDLRQNGMQQGAPVAHEYTAFVRDAYRPQNGRLAAYTSVYLKRSTVTNTSYADPRVSLVYNATRNDVVRVASGATTTQPTADLLDRAFTPASLLTAGGGGGITCGGVNALGSAPSSLLKPERGVDEELAYGHRFSGDSQVQLELYVTNVFGKIYSSLTPLSSAGTAFIPATTLAAAETLVRTACGGVDPLSVLGVSGAVNLGQLRAQGFTLSGRQRLSRATFVDYDYDTTSTTLRSAPSDYLRNNLTAVLGSQVPNLPLHTLALSLDGLMTPAVDVRYMLHGISDNNNKHSSGYNYSDLRASLHTRAGTLTAYVYNLFDQDATIRGYLGEGTPLALNRYATPQNYAPYAGANATERFGLPYRSFFVSFTFQAR